MLETVFGTKKWTKKRWLGFQNVLKIVPKMDPFLDLLFERKKVYNFGQKRCQKIKKKHKQKMRSMKERRANNKFSGATFHRKCKK